MTATGLYELVHVKDDFGPYGFSQAEIRRINRTLKGTVKSILETGQHLRPKDLTRYLCEGLDAEFKDEMSEDLALRLYSVASAESASMMSLSIQMNADEMLDQARDILDGKGQ